MVAKTKKITFQKLRKFNIFMSLLHFVQGVLMLVLSNDFTLPINTSFVEFNQASKQLEPVLNTIADIKLGPLVAVFLFMSSAAHLLISLPKINDWYNKNLGKGINHARWIEYAFSSSVMIVIISMLTGVYDFATLLLMFALNACMILFGWLMEVHNQTTTKTNWMSYWFGCLAGAIPWLIIALYLFNAGDGDNRAPDFVYWIFLSLFIFFNSFAINMVLQYKKTGKWKDYLFGEYTYIMLSLIAKSLLAWQVWAGTLRPV